MNKVRLIISKHNVFLHVFRFNESLESNIGNWNKKFATRCFFIRKAYFFKAENEHLAFLS